MAYRRQRYQPQEPNDFEPWQPESAPVDDFEPWQPEPMPQAQAQPQQQQQLQAQPPEPQAQQPDDFVPWQPEPQQAPPEPQAEGTIGTALRSAAHAVLPSAAGLAGIPAGIAGGAALGLPAAGWGAIPGAIAGGIAGYIGGSKVQESALKAMGFDDSQQMAVNTKTNPKSALVGEIAGALPTVGVGAGVNAVVRAGGALGGGLLETAGQAFGDEPWDPTRIGGAAIAGALLTKPTRLGEAIGSRTAAAIGRPDIWHGANQPHGTPGSEAAAGTAEAKPPPLPQPGDVEQPRSSRRYAKEPVAAEPLGPQVTPFEPDPAVTMAVRGEPIQPRVTEVEPPTQYGPALEREFPRVAQPQVTEMPETAAPVQGPEPQVFEGGEAPPLVPAPATPREAMAQRAPEETYGQVLQRLAADERGGGRRPPKPPPEEAPPEAMPTPRAFEGPALPDRSAATSSALTARGFTPDEISRLTPEQAYEILQKREGEVGSGPKGDEILRQEAQVRATPAAPVVPTAPAAEMPTPTGGGRLPPPGSTSPSPGVPPSEKPTLHMPATESDKAQGLFPSLRRMFMPMTSESAQAAGAAVREATGPLARLKEQARTRFTSDLHQVVNKMDVPAFEKFVDTYESGQAHTLPKEQQPLAKALGRNYADFWKEIEKLPGTSKMEATKDFLTHMYDNSNGQVDRFVSEWRGGGGGSLRKRTHPTFADARAAGLTQLSNNPIEHFGRYAESLSNHIAQRRVMADLEGQGRIAYFAPKVEGASGSPRPLVKGSPPEGYTELKMPWAEKNGKRAYAPRDVAETLNQYYAAGMRSAATKDIYEFAQRTKNSWTALELGLSAYHGVTMAVEATTAGMARALQMAARGDFAGATKQLIKAPGELATSYLYGRELRKTYRGEKVGDRGGLSGALDYVGEKAYGKRTRSPETQEILDIFTKANIQPGNKPLTKEAISGATMREQDMSKLGNLWDAKKNGSLMHEITSEIQKAKDTYGLSIPKSTLDAITRGVQTISKPLFEHYIPELKLGSMMKDMETWLHANPTTTSEQKLSMARKIADSTDNRMGEMNYDNLFINKTAKDLSMLTLRSFAFTIGGPIREIGGGAASLARGAMKGQNRLSVGSEHFDPRAAYAAAFLPTIAAISATIQYMRTGEGPEDWRDLVTPKTGGTVKSGGQMVPERILVPGYHKDFLGYFFHPGDEISAKLAAPWNALKEQITGKDFRGDPIAPPISAAGYGAHIAGRAGALGSQLLPIGTKQLFETPKEGSNISAVERALGFRAPGAYIQNPERIGEVKDIMARKAWRARERHENTDRAIRGLPPLPPRQFREVAGGGQ